MPSHLKLVVEKHLDGYIAYPLGIGRGAILGQGDNYEDALADVRSAIAFHVETFGEESLAPSSDGPVLEAFGAEVILDSQFDVPQSRAKFPESNIFGG